MLVADEAHARAAARNNADWCHAVCRAHGLPGVFSAGAWTNPRRTPPYYPDAVTLSPAASVEHVLEGIDHTSPGCSIKDSFARLELGPAGFRILFEAAWIYRPAGVPCVRTDVGWRPAADPADLLAWEAAWSEDREPAGLFPPALLADRTVTFLGDWQAGRLVAGCVASTSPAVVGISNLFTLDGDLDAAWSGALAAITARFPGRPVVGYDRDAGLTAAARHCFTVVGPLRVWLGSA